MLLKFNREKPKEIPNQIVEFKLGEKLFGIEVSRVVEIINLRNFSTISESDSFLKGIVNVRGHILPIVDIRQKFQIGSEEIGKLPSRDGVVPGAPKPANRLDGGDLAGLSRAIVVTPHEINLGILVDGTKHSLRNTIGAKVKEKPYPSDLCQLILEIDDLEIPIINSEKIFNSEEIKRLENLKNTY